jgi:hypothetical protein
MAIWSCITPDTGEPMSKPKKRKGPKAEALIWDDFKTDKPYEGYFPRRQASKTEPPPVRRRSEIIVTTRTFKEMPNGDLIMEVSRHTEPVPKGADTSRSTGIDPADIRMYTDRAGLLHIAERRRRAGKRARPTQTRAVRRKTIARA